MTPLIEELARRRADSAIACDAHLAFIGFVDRVRSLTESSDKGVTLHLLEELYDGSTTYEELVSAGLEVLSRSEAGEIDDFEILIEQSNPRAVVEG